jgi:hypothetical protein
MAITMRRVDDADAQTGQPGDFDIDPPNEWNKGHIYFVCPNGRNCGVPIRNGDFADTGVKRWGFDGNGDRPTLTPSINCNGPAGCGWHGHIRKGEMTGA